MYLKPVFIYLFLLVFLPVPAVLASYAAIDVQAAYGSSLADSAADLSFSDVLPASGSALAELGPDDYAAGSATAYSDGRMGVSGFSEGFSVSGGGVSAFSSSVSSADWMVGSYTLAAGTPVRIGLELLIEGTLYSEAAGSVSSAEISLLYDGQERYGGTVSFAYSAGLDVKGAWSYGFYSTGSTSYMAYEYGAVEIDAAVGQIINLALLLQTGIDCAAGAGGGARTDFSNSASYTFTYFFEPDADRSVDAYPVLIPEPACGLLLAAGALRLRKRSQWGGPVSRRKR